MEFFVLILLSLSLLANIFLTSYIRYLLEQLSFVSENIGSLVKTISDLREHLSEVYELERFYGDPTLEALLRHTSETAMILEDFEDIYALVEELEEENEEDFADDSGETEDSQTT